MADIKLSSRRCEEIKKIVVEMFVKYDVSCVPINGFEIASKMGIHVVPYSAYPSKKRGLLLKKSEDGFSLEKNIGEWYIFYNDKKGYRRTNNTIMHEIGHIVLDHTEDSELAEKEVNFFAKYALVPPVLVHKLEISSYLQIVKFFDVSFEAAKYAFEYYQKWLEFGGSDYTLYERITLELFKNVG
ncbi:MAG: ImmA/IrrE family metallo-endopeptidase [Clostridia bacterium]|nr:ImmA/IrrE family metallo-endopeptidase [Clostridia bacterium]